MGERLQWTLDGQAWPHRAASRFVVAGGLRWHVQVMGQGPALWLLHGTGAAGFSWRGLVPLLAPHHTLVVPDLPGHGYSAALPRPQQSLAGMAAALVDLGHQLGLPPLALVGHSAGAALAARAVLDGGLRPAALVGFNAALLPLGGVVGPVLGPLVGPLFGQLARWLGRSRWAPGLAARRTGDPAAVRRLVAATGSRLDDEGLALYARLLRSPDHLAGVLAMVGDWDLEALWRDLPRLPVPLTLWVGDADATVPPSQADRVAARCPGSTVHHRSGLGHLAHEEAPQWAAEAVRQALVAAQRRDS